MKNIYKPILNELENKIRKAIPELMELGVGCELKYGSETIYICSHIQKELDKEFIYLISKDNISNRKMIVFNDVKIEIIGKPIQLNHVLQYVNSLSYTIESWHYRKVLKLWNLKSNLLSEQSSELIKYINEL